MKFFRIELRSLIKFLAIGLIWGVVPVTAQFRNYPSWQEYWIHGDPCLFFLAGFTGSFVTSLYQYHLESKKSKNNREN